MDSKNLFVIQSDMDPLSYKVVRGETTFARCRDIEAAQLVVEMYNKKENNMNGKLSYE